MHHQSIPLSELTNGKLAQHISRHAHQKMFTKEKEKCQRPFNQQIPIKSDDFLSSKASLFYIAELFSAALHGRQLYWILRIK